MQSKTLTLSRKLMLAFGLISLVTMIEALIVWNNIRSVDLEMKRVIESLVPQTERIAVLETTIFRASLETRHAMLMRTDEKRTKTIEEILRLKAEADRISQELERHISTEEGRKRFAKITQTSGVFWSAAGEILPLIKAGQTEAAVDMLEAKIIPARNDFLGAITYQREWQKELLGTASRSALKVGEATE
jgi:methyl-accepting chemotaxis protein